MRRSCTATTITRCGSRSRATCPTRSRSRPRGRTRGRGRRDRRPRRAWPSTCWWTCSPRPAAATRRRTSSPPRPPSSSRSTKPSKRHGCRPRIDRPAGPRRGPAGDDARTHRARGRFQLAHAGARRAVPARVRRLSILLRHLPEPGRPPGRQRGRVRRPRQLPHAGQRRRVLAGGPQHLHVRVRHHDPEAGRRPGDGAGHQPAVPRPQPGPGLPAAAVHRADGALDGGLDVDPRSDLQRRELAAGARRDHQQRLLLARQRLAGHVVADRRQHVARHALLRHHAAGRPADDLARPLRSGRHRRRQHHAALPLGDAAGHQAGAHHRDDVLGDLHLRRFPAHLRAHPRRARQRHPRVLHAGVRHRHVGRPARHGRRRRAVHPAGAGRPHRGPDDLPQARIMVGGRDFFARLRRLYLPLAVFVVLGLFPFYWMLLTSIKPNRELYSQKIMPLVVHQPTLKHYVDLLTETNFLTWTYNTMLVAVVTTVISLVLGTMMAYPLARMRFPGTAVVAIGVAATYLVPQPLLFIPMSDIINRLELGNTLTAVMLTYPTLLIPFCAWLLMGYFKSVPRELEESARIDGASRLQAMTRIVLPLCTPGLLSAGIFAFTLAQNEFLYALIFLAKSEVRTVPVGAITELIRGDVFYWGQLMAAALLGSIPVALIYSFFVDYYVAGLTAGSVKN